jgi:hypothetical protein
MNLSNNTSALRADQLVCHFLVDQWPEASSVSKFLLISIVYQTRLIQNSQLVYREGSLAFRRQIKEVLEFQRMLCPSYSRRLPARPRTKR